MISKEPKRTRSKPKRRAKAVNAYLLSRKAGLELMR